MKPNKENIVNEIILQLEEGKSYKETSLVIISKYKFTEPTFVRYWKKANERFAERQISIQNELAKDSADAAKERLKRAIISRDESLAMLSNVAKILFAKIANEKDKPDTFDVNAFNTTMSNVAKLEGWNAPAKVAQTDSRGKDVKPVDLSKYLDFDQLMSLQAEMNDASYK